MSVFNDYSKYYNLLYQDKDYQNEVSYIQSLIEKHLPQNLPKTFLDLGCGTAKHIQYLLKSNFEITGVDFSQTMLDIAKSNTLLSDVNFQLGDIRTFRNEKKYSVVSSLFHVMSYQTSNEDLDQSFETASRHLVDDGVFVFDFWYGPGVLNDPPKNPTKTIENDHLLVERKTRSKLIENENCVEVKFDMNISTKADGQKFQLDETHKMRYLFLPEIESLCQRHDLNIKNNFTWLTTKEASKDAWYVVCVAQKNKNLKGSL